MRRAGLVAFAMLLTLVPLFAAAQEKNLLSLASDLGAVLEWDPLRDAGVLSFGDDRISLKVGAEMALVNYRLKVEIDPPFRRDGAVWLTTAAVTAISDAVQKDRLAHAAQHMRVAFILIDPGHGGKDGGAVGTYMDGKKEVTVKEKDVTLSVARKLAALLAASFPDKQILFTRSDDTFVSLEDRVVVANGLLAKTKETVLYLSIHANTSPFNRKASGFEVWCLPPEYKRTLLDEKATGKENQDILPILNSMLEEEISVESTVLAREILAGLDSRVGDRTEDRGMRQNDWYVVRNARMPAVLTEVGFCACAPRTSHLALPCLRDLPPSVQPPDLARDTRLHRDLLSTAGQISASSPRQRRRDTILGRAGSRRDGPVSSSPGVCTLVTRLSSRPARGPPDRRRGRGRGRRPLPLGVGPARARLAGGGVAGGAVRGAARAPRSHRGAARAHRVRSSGASSRRLQPLPAGRLARGTGSTGPSRWGRPVLPSPLAGRRVRGPTRPGLLVCPFSTACSKRRSPWKARCSRARSWPGSTAGSAIARKTGACARMTGTWCATRGCPRC